MATRQGDSEAIADRCRKAGWEVDASLPGGGFKVRNPRGEMFYIHLTYSDVNSHKSLMRDLVKGGLVADETAIRRARLTEKRTRSQVAAEAAEERAQKMAEKTSLIRAAGPYLVEVEDIELEWYIKPHPSPWMRFGNITPAIARHILDNCNGDNRALDQRTVQHYKRIILAGLWQLTHQGLAFDTRGWCQDGQHRLAAISEAAQENPDFESVPFAVFVGMAVENFKAIDEGRLRTAAQLFSRTGEKNNSTLQTCVRLVYYLNEPNARSAARLRLPNSVIIDRFDDDADNYRDAVSFARTTQRKIHLGLGALAASYYLLYKANGPTNAYVNDFFAALKSGAIPGTRMLLDDADPRRVLRERVENMRSRGDRRNALSQVGMVITTWNNCVQSRSPRSLHFTDVDPIPQILRCTPGEGAAPQAFRQVTE